MINIHLDERVESLRPLILDLALYNDINNITIEVGDEQLIPDSLFINLEACKTLEDVMAAFALKIRGLVKRPARARPSSHVVLDYKYGNEAQDIASVIETAIEPMTFFELERYTL